MHMPKKYGTHLKYKNLSEYHDLCVQSDTLLLENVYENFRNMYHDVYELDSVYFVSAQE